MPLHGNKAKGQWGESPSFLCIAPTVKHLSCSCKSPDNQPELSSAGDIPCDPENPAQHGQNSSTGTRNHFSPKNLLVLQEPVKNEQMLLLPFDFPGWKHILNNVFQWHHLRILAAWWREMSREIPKATLGITSSNFHFLHRIEPALWLLRVSVAHFSLKIPLSKTPLSQTKRLPGGNLLSRMLHSKKIDVWSCQQDPRSEHSVGTTLKQAQVRMRNQSNTQIFLQSQFRAWHFRPHSTAQWQAIRHGSNMSNMRLQRNKQYISSVNKNLCLSLFLS